MFRNEKGISLKIHRLTHWLLTIVTVAIFLTSCTTSSIRNNVISQLATTAPALITPTRPLVITPSLPTTPPVEQKPSATPISPSPQPSTPTNALPSAQPPASSPSPQVDSTTTQPANLARIKTVFLIVMENHNWSDIINSPSAPYINNTLLPQASYALQYYNPSGLHPSEPNYIWLEAGTSLGITSDDPPKDNHQSTTDHLVAYLVKAGITWKSYLENITGKVCPLENNGLFTPKHNPMLFFDDVTNQNDPNSAYCIAHERPFEELKSDLSNSTVAQYNFITPNQCDNMHSSDGCQSQDKVKNGDTWLSQVVPMIMSSQAYQQGGVIFITWDESEGGDHPIGMIVLSPFAKGGGYSNSLRYDHSSTLRTIQEIFHITPYLGNAAGATDLSDLFTNFP